jgi:NAD(P)-dependent dehydrogenase (short-subunit alcohol dehydrogenase family)
MSGRVAEKVAIVTGGAVGIGAATSRILAREGARVVIADVDTLSGEELSSQIRDHGHHAIFIRHDVALEESWHLTISLAVAEYGGLDVLVNNAGIGFPNGSVEEQTLEQWRSVMSVNLDGVFLGTKAAIAAMRKTGRGGSIINISSIAGLVGNPNGSSAYTATKGAVRLFTKATATQHAKDNIRCNSVHPGPIDTDMMRDVLGDPTLRAARLQRIPLGKAGTAEDVAYGVLYLASDESSFVTGSELVIDGGATAQ